MRRFHVTFAELRAEALQEADLLLGEFELSVSGGLLKAQQPLVFGQKSMALPHPSHAPRRHLDALQARLLLDP